MGIDITKTRDLMQYIKAKELDQKGIVTILPYRLQLKGVVTFKCISYKSKEK